MTATPAACSWRKGAGGVGLDELPVLADAWDVPYWRVRQAWLYMAAVAEHRRAAGADPVIRRDVACIPTGPLWRLVRGHELRCTRYGTVRAGVDAHAMAARLGLGAPSAVWALLRKRAISLDAAERYCHAAGEHPGEVWGHWYYACAAVLSGLTDNPEGSNVVERVVAA